MNSAVRKYWLLLAMAMAVLAFAPSSFAQASMQLTGVNGSSAGGVYTDPYFGTINGVSSTIICDDYADDSYFNETWQANATNVASAGSSSTVKWIGNGDTVHLSGGPTLTMDTQTLYDAIGYLSTQMLGAGSGEPQEAYSFALWELTCTYGTPNAAAGLGKGCPTTDPFKTISGQLLTDAQNDLNAALSQNYTPGEFSNVEIYTPIDGTQGMCGSNPCTTTPPQEFITVPESSTIAMLGADMLGLVVLAFFFRRRLVHPIS